ncbi:MAG: adenylate kinase [Pseudomonadota bacterium]
MARDIGAIHVDIDDFYWERSDPPFRRKVAVPRRIARIRRAINGVDSWVMSGSLVSWGHDFVAAFTHAVFLELDATVRIARLKHRERERFGARISLGGDMHEAHNEFMTWASAYDTVPSGQRCRAVHVAWLASLPCAKLVLDASRPVEGLVADTQRWLASSSLTD